jgi:Domain of unknown function (DUF4405)
MAKNAKLSGATRQNWLIDAAVFIGALLATLTGIYFLFLPIGGYQGGQNPTYGLTIFFARTTWSDIHVWGGILMIAAVAIHFTLHWSWVGMMSRKVKNTLTNSGGKFSKGAKINVLVDLFVALGFVVTAVTGIYFLFVPAGYGGGRVLGWDPGILFSRSTWDLLHTWGAIVMIIGALLHLVIHWRWIVNVSRRIWPSTALRPSGKLSNS